VYKSLEMLELGLLKASARGGCVIDHSLDTTAAIIMMFVNLGIKISLASGDDREGAFLFQRVSVLVQRYNTTPCRH